MSDVIREAFEKWALSRYGEKFSLDEYGEAVLGFGWDAWQAALKSQTAPAVPVGWQFYQDGKWHNGDDRIKNHRANTEEAGIPTRDLYTRPAESREEIQAQALEMMAFRHESTANTHTNVTAKITCQKMAKACRQQAARLRASTTKE